MLNSLSSNEKLLIFDYVTSEERTAVRHHQLLAKVIESSYQLREVFESVLKIMFLPLLRLHTNDLVFEMASEKF